MLYFSFHLSLCVHVWHQSCMIFYLSLALLEDFLIFNTGLYFISFLLCAAFKRLSRLEGIIPALETSHALAFLEKLCPTLPDGTKLVLNCSGRGDKDVHTAIKHLKV